MSIQVEHSGIYLWGGIAALGAFLTWFFGITEKILNVLKMLKELRNRPPTTSGANETSRNVFQPPAEGQQGTVLTPLISSAIGASLGGATAMVLAQNADLLNLPEKSLALDHINTVIDAHDTATDGHQLASDVADTFSDLTELT